MRLDEIIKQPENRKLEFKESLPNKIDLCKTIVSFANDAGGEIYIGVKNNPREIIGVPEEELLEIEETITNIKIAIFDDKIEITSPGKLMPTIDFDDMESGQSDIRNKVLAQVFKKLGIIEQWGNGLRLIAEELKKYPEIKFEWSEPGISFRVTFRKLNYKPDTKKADLVKSATDYDRLRPIATDYDQLSIEESKILLYLLDNKKITKREAAELINAKETKTKEVLKGLVQKGLIQRKGKGRSVYYVLNEEKR